MAYVIGSETMQVFFFIIICLYVYCRWGSNYQKERIIFLLTGLTLPHFFVCPKDMDFQRHMREVIVCVVDIGGIVDQLCLSHLLIMMRIRL